MIEIPTIQNTNSKDLEFVRISIKRLENSFKSLEWGRMTEHKNQRIDQMIEETTILINSLLKCKENVYKKE